MRCSSEFPFLPGPQRVTLELEAAPWYAALSEAQQVLDLAPGDAAALSALIPHYRSLGRTRELIAGGRVGVVDGAARGAAGGIERVREPRVGPRARAGGSRPTVSWSGPTDPELPDSPACWCLG